MPQRLLRPELKNSRRWNRLSWQAQSFYLRVLMEADDFGRYEADAEFLSRDLFPYGDPHGRTIRSASIEEWLQELERGDLLSIYTHDGNRYLQLQRWKERRRSASKYPEPIVVQTGKMPVPLADAGKCPQMPADAGKRGQVPSNVVTPADNCGQMLSPPTSTSTSTSTSTREREKGVSNAADIAVIQGSKLRAGVLLAQIRELEAQGKDLGGVGRGELRKKRAELRRLQEKQARGEF